MPQPPDHPVPHDRVTHGLAHDETRAGALAVPGEQMHDQTAASRADTAPHHGAELVTVSETSVRGKHAAPRRTRRRSRTRTSGGEPVAALTPTGGQNGPPCPRTHPQPEPVGPRASTVVRLEGALALAHGCRSPGLRRPVFGLVCSGARRKPGRLNGAAVSGRPFEGTHRPRRDRHRPPAPDRPGRRPTTRVTGRITVRHPAGCRTSPRRGPRDGEVRSGMAP